MLQNGKVLMTNKSTIWDNIDGSAEQYKCATALQSLSMLFHTCNIVIYRGVVAPGNGKDVVDGLNATDNFFPTILMTTMKIPGAVNNDSQVSMHT